MKLSSVKGCRGKYYEIAYFLRKSNEIEDKLLLDKAVFSLFPQLHRMPVSLLNYKILLYLGVGGEIYWPAQAVHFACQRFWTIDPNGKGFVEMRFSAANIRLSKGVRPFLIRKHDTQPKPRTLGKPTMVKLLKRVEEQVIDRLGQIDTTDIHAVVLAVCRPNDEHSSPGPCHPACMEFASSSYCRKSWDGYLARLNRCPRTCWGTCLHQRVCAMIPITCQGRSLAVVQLAAPASTEQAEFRRVVDLVELLVRDFVTMHADFLHRVPGGIPARAAVAEGGDLSAGRNHPLSPTHPQVLRAMEQIDANISDPHLNVAGVASVLGMNPTYLSELFVKQLGQRMSGFISARRMENARKLLADTDWQVKRIALEVGYANPNWFGQVFRNHTGQTPLQCRATARASR